jgi:hypothetical protein
MLAWWKALVMVLVSSAAGFGAGWTLSAKQSTARIALAEKTESDHARAAKEIAQRELVSETSRRVLEESALRANGSPKCSPADPGAPVVPVASRVRGDDISVTLFNRSNAPADALRFSAYMFDGFGDPVRRKYRTDFSNMFTANHSATIAAHSEKTLCCWDADDFSPLPARVDVTVTEVHFADGSQWSGCGEPLAVDPRPGRLPSGRKRECNRPWPEKCDWEAL